jgi:hypothetical protein
MKRCIITNDDRKLLEANKQEKKQQLAALNADMTKLVATGHSKMLDETPFLPTGPKAYQLIETEHYKKWIQKIRDSAPEKKWVGKSYFGIADEYTEASEKVSEKLLDQKEVDQITEAYIDETGHQQVKIRDDYDPNHANEVDDSELTTEEKHVFDFATIKNKVVANLEWSLDDLFDDIEESLRELHADEDDYRPPENLKEVVATMQKTEQLKILEYKRQQAEALEYNADKKMQ